MQFTVSSFTVSSFYCFHPLEREKLETLRRELMNAAKSSDQPFDRRTPAIQGLVILSHEGINGTVSGLPNQISRWKERLKELIPAPELSFKDSVNKTHPFKRFKIELRESIVDGGEIMPSPKDVMHNHLSPEQWQEWLTSGREFTLLDVRNLYESEIGVFEGAVAAPINKFKELPQAMSSLNIDKERPLLTYCTGGIRCEKAVLALELQGYKQVYQLAGGILAYLERYPESHFKGECFVFDHRVAVDQRLDPSKRYRFCHRCGQTGERRGECHYCGGDAYLCGTCIQKFPHLACSKNCDYHLKRGSQRSTVTVQIER